MGFLTLLGNRYVVIGIIVAVLAGGIWLKIHSLQSDVAAAQKELATQVEDNKALKGNNAVLKQNLDLALSVNDQNAKLLEGIRADQEHAATSLQKLSTDLSHAKLTIEQARSRLNAVKLPSVPVPQAIVDAVLSIQQSRTEQAELNKKLEATQ